MLEIAHKDDYNAMLKGVKEPSAVWQCNHIRRHTQYIEMIAHRAECTVYMYRVRFGHSFGCQST